MTSRRIRFSELKLSNEMRRAKNRGTKEQRESARLGLLQSLELRRDFLRDIDKEIAIASDGCLEALIKLWKNRAEDIVENYGPVALRGLTRH